MKEFLKSKKGIITIGVLVIVILALILGIVKCTDSSDGLQKDTDKTKTEEENKEVVFKPQLIIRNSTSEITIDTK